MSTVHKLEGGLLMVTKGAVDVLLNRSVVTPEERREIEQVNEQFSNAGLRVLVSPAAAWTVQRSDWRTKTS